MHFNPISPRYWRKRSEELVLTTLLEIFWNLLVSTNNKSHLMMIKCYKLKMLEKKKIRTMPLLHLTDISQQILLTVYVYRIIFFLRRLPINTNDMLRPRNGKMNLQLTIDNTTFSVNKRYQRKRYSSGVNSVQNIESV